MDRKSLFLIAMISLCFLQLPSFALSGWDSYDSYSVDTSTAVTNYPVFLNLTHETEMMPDFSGLNITDESENALPFWIEDFGASSWAGIWIRGDWEVTDNVQMLVHYENTSVVSSGSNSSLTFPGVENFYKPLSNGTLVNVFDDTLDDPVDTSYSIINATSDIPGDLLFWTFQNTATNYLLGDINDYTTVQDIQFTCSLNSTIGGAGAGSGCTVSKRQPTEQAGDYILTVSRPNATYKQIRLVVYSGSGSAVTVFETFPMADDTEFRARSLFYEANDSVEFWINGSLIFSNTTMTNDLEPTATDFRIQSEGQSTELAGGITNVMMGTDGSTVGNLLYLDTEPVVSESDLTVRIFANDTSTGTLISDFTVTASNSTNTSEFTASGTSAVWNITSGPIGNVSILITAGGFNHTAENITVTLVAGVNFTASLDAARIIISPVDFEFWNVTVPASITLVNGTHTLVSEPIWEAVADEVSISRTVAGNETAFTTNLTGMMARYALRVDASPNVGGTGANTSITIYSEDGSESQVIDFEAAAPGDPASSTGFRYFYISKDATWKILEADGSSHDTGTFSFFPVKIVGRGFVDTGGGGAYEAEVLLAGPTPSHEFFLPNSSLIGNVTITASQFTDGFFGFLENTYADVYYFRELVTTSSFINQTVYMTNPANTYSTRFVVVDEQNAIISNSIVSIFSATVEGDLIEIGSSQTDSKGETQTFEFIQGSEVLVFAQSGTRNTGDLLKTFINVDDNAVVIQISAFVPVVDDPLFDGLTVSFTPEEGTNLIEGESYWFNLTVVDIDSLLENTTFNITSSALNFSILNFSTSTGAVSFSNFVTIPVTNNSGGTIEMAYNISRTGDAGTIFFGQSVSYILFPDFSLATVAEVAPALGNLRYFIALIVIAGAYSIDIPIGVMATIALFIIGFIPLEVSVITAIAGVAFIWVEMRK